MMPQRRSARLNVYSLEAVPQTPTGRVHDEINSIIKDLERRWKLGLATRDKTWSPSHSADHTSEQEKCSSRIKFLFHKDRNLLDVLIADFNKTAQSMPPRTQLAYLLHSLEENSERLSPARRAFSSLTLKPLPRKLEQETPASYSAAPLPRSPSASGLFHSHTSAQAEVTSENAPSPNTPQVSTNGLASLRSRTPPNGDDDTLETMLLSPSMPATLRGHQYSHSIDHESRHGLNGKRRFDGAPSHERSPKNAKWSNHKRQLANLLEASAPISKPSLSTSSSGSSYRHSSNTSRTNSYNSIGSSNSGSIFSQAQHGTITANTSFSMPIDCPQSLQLYRSQVDELHKSATYDPIGNEIDWVEVGKMTRKAAGFAPNAAHDVFGQRAPESFPDIVSPARPMEQHQVKALPTEGLFVPDICLSLKRRPFKYRWELLRIALELGTGLDELIPGALNEECQDYSALWDHFQHHRALKGCTKQLEPSSPKAWAAADSAFENVTLKATLSYNDKNSGPIFKLQLKPLQHEATSCRFHRAFGSQRFLHVNVPSFQRESLPTHLKSQEHLLHRRFQEWLACKDKRFLGRRWQVMHIELLKQQKKATLRSQDDARGYRVILFATKGCDLREREAGTIRSGTQHELSIYDLFDWFMPLSLNSHQRSHKAFARISLGLTSTLPTITFKPSEVRFVPDILGNEEPEDCQYNDPTLVWPRDEVVNRVMNDGCSRISVGAARELWKALKRDDPLPSVFQGRIGGAKGMWMLSSSPNTADAIHGDRWIEVSESQRKFKPHRDDMDDRTFDPCRLMFDLHSTTHTAEPSVIYLSFFPILHDRGVPFDALQALFGSYMDQERDALLQAVMDADMSRMRKWIHDHNTLAEERSRDDDLAWQGGMPLQVHEKAILLLESGFDTSCDYLANVVHRLAARSLRVLRQDVRVPLARCTYIKGVADPYGILAPGEIHVHFTKGFIDQSGECLSFLDNCEVLVARNPALRRSDIQKVRASFKLDLAHLKDVVVFSTRGSFPLAGKLQGGDYDGDTFWVCWEPTLAKPFKNAPAPLEDPKPEKYGIKVDKETMGEVNGDLSIEKFLQKSFEFRCKPNLLGQATKLYEKVYYEDNSFDSAKVKALADLHDLLVDYSKNGYEFGYDDFESFKNKFNIKKNMRKPRHEEAREHDKDEASTSSRTRAGKRDSNDTAAYNEANILDRIYFETVEPHTRETLDMLVDHFKSIKSSFDPALAQPFLNALEIGKTDPAIAETLDTLLTTLRREIIAKWNNTLHGNKSRYGSPTTEPGDVLEACNKAVSICHPMFRALRPANPDASPIVAAWAAGGLVPGVIPEWELLKASALYHVWSERRRLRASDSEEKRSSAFVFFMAGVELCWIKAHARGRDAVRPMITEMWANLRPRKIKKPAYMGSLGETKTWKWKDQDRDNGSRSALEHEESECESDDTDYMSAVERLGDD